MSNPIGRPRAVAPKAAILAILRAAAPVGVTCGQVSQACGTTIRVVREHLQHLEDLCEVTHVRACKPNGRVVILFAIIDQPMQLPEGFTIAPPAILGTPKSPEDDSWLALVQVRKPVGQWRADHIPAVRSVFDLGGRA